VKTLRAVWLGVALACAGRAVAAQNPHRNRFWLELGGGPGAIRIGCGGCPGVTTSSGSTGYFRLGGSLSEKVLLGVETFGFTDETFQFTDQDPAFVAENETLVAVVLWYPWRGGVFLKGGVGLAGGRFTVATDSGATAVAQGVGVGLTLGVGFDYPISRRLALTANAATFITGIGDLRIGPALVDDVIPELYQLSIGLALR
jgi:hypothetical protein